MHTLLLALATVSALAGLWDTPVDKSQVRVESCGPDVCGYVVSSARLVAEPDQKDVRNEDPALRSRLIKNLKIMQIHPDGGAWKGWVYDPARGRVIHVTVRMKPDDRILITGCLVGPLCGSQSWTRAQ
jgi:uncharacterized protein (DUF2147 family)